jgi:hypothetical protein
MFELATLLAGGLGAGLRFRWFVRSDAPRSGCIVITRSNASRSGNIHVRRHFGARSIAPRGDDKKMFPFPTPRSRQRIPQPERDELDEARFIAVRQITAFMPAFEALRLGLFRQRLIPVVFTGDETTEMFAFGLGGLSIGNLVAKRI